MLRPVCTGNYEGTIRRSSLSDNLCNLCKKLEQGSAMYCMRANIGMERDNH